VDCGVPQGSVLGPLLFLLYVNDIGRAVPQGNVKLFADDTNLFIFDSSCVSINAEANLCVYELNQWFIVNKLSLNLVKTCCMNFSTKPLSGVILHCGLNVINEVDSCKYLGLVIDSDLKWTSHIDAVYRELVKYSSIFYKVRERLPAWMLKHIYFAFVHSRIIYGIEVYANTCSSHLDKLIKLNNKLLRILQNKPLSTQVFELYLAYNTLPIPQLHIQQLLLFVNKFMHHPDTLPVAFIKNSYFITNRQVHNYPTRDNTDCLSATVRSSSRFCSWTSSFHLYRPVTPLERSCVHLLPYANDAQLFISFTSSEFLNNISSLENIITETCS
jgi:hypothetical protein